MTPRELTPAEKFDRLFTSLIRVPKAEIDHQEKKRQRAKKRAAKKT